MHVPLRSPILLDSCTGSVAVQVDNANGKLDNGVTSNDVISNGGNGHVVPMVQQPSGGVCVGTVGAGAVYKTLGSSQSVNSSTGDTGVRVVDAYGKLNNGVTSNGGNGHVVPMVQQPSGGVCVGTVGAGAVDKTLGSSKLVNSSTGDMAVPAVDVCGKLDKGMTSKGGDGHPFQTVPRLINGHTSNTAGGAVGQAAVLASLRNAWCNWLDGLEPSRPSVEAGAQQARTGRRQSSKRGRHGSARFIQRVVRAARALGRWRQGGVRLVVAMMSLGWRRRSPRCGGGANLATEAEFATQHARAREVLDWYSIYVALLRRLQSGVTPCVVECFCGGGGTTEGTRRAGGTSHGVDRCHQADYVRRYGSESFTEADATDWSVVKALAEKTGAVGGCASPPCQSYSTATTHSEHPALIPRVRAMMRSLFDYWSIENVAGARSSMQGSVVELTGSLFGLRVARPRLFESNFDLHVDTYLSEPAVALEARCCLGARRRWKRFDELGRACEACCVGNIFSPLGESPWRCTSAECAAAMGVDASHMSYERLAQSVPPAYAELRFSQMCMAVARDRFGAPHITFDQMLAAPHAARRELAMWLRGAGDAAPTAGLSLRRPVVASRHQQGSVQGVGAWPTALGDEFEWGVGAAGFDAEAESAHREFFYSHAGGFDQCWSEGYAGGAWMQPLGRHVQLDAAPAADVLSGSNTYVDVRDDVLEAAWPELERALGLGSGTRVSVRVDACSVGRWLSRGFTVLEWEEAYRGAEEASAAVRARPLMWAGRRRGARSTRRLVHSEVRSFMDPRDQSAWKPIAEEKAAFIFAPMEVDRGAWAAASEMPAAVRELMTAGAQPNLGFEPPKGEIPQYELGSAEGLHECIWECDRALAVGHLEFVPECELDQVRMIHPWQVALKEGKARACQDYSGGLNPATESAAFSLPSAWDVRRRMGPDTHFAKRDLRDGFWAVPIAEERRNLFVLRHPSTGRLVRATSLPFGWKDSPRLFCSVTEAIAGEFRRRASDGAVDCVIHCFVDDYLLQGVSEGATQAGIELLDEVMAELGLFWAPHKERGPARVMEFLGLLLVNVPGLQCIGLTERRQLSLGVRIDEWMARRGSETTADPVELAKLVGHLVFVSQVVPGGRTYLQGMVSQLSGLEVDWARGVVRPLRVAGGGWRRVQLSGAFWRDLEWWQDALETRNCTELERPARASAAVTGTDASDWGTGQVAFLAGGREELQLRFTAAELRRTINWRELLGIVRIIELYGERLRGMLVLIEGDNTASLGAATKWSSKSPGMQELVRRLFDACERWSIVPRFCHTPGVLLHRPDQTSRGDAVEEPRARLNSREFERVVRRFGGFTEFVGAEREHVCAAGEDRVAGGGVHIWMHPTYTTVGSALRLLGERAADAGGEPVRAVLLVPDEPTAAWRPLLRHFRVEGRLSAGGTQVEMCQMGQWRALPSRRQSLLLTFPRAAGSEVTRVWLGGEAARVQLEGAVLYQPRPGRSGRGQLYVVRKSFDASGVDTQWSDRGVPTVAVAELLLTDASRGGVPCEQRYELSWANEGKKRPAGSFCLGGDGGFDPWQVDVDQLWEVGRLVKSHERVRAPSRGPLAAASVDAVGQLARQSFQFDFARAEAEIKRLRAEEPSMVMPAPISDSDGDAVASPTPSSASMAGSVGRTPRHVSDAPLRIRVATRLGREAPPGGLDAGQVEPRRSARHAAEPDRLTYRTDDVPASQWSSALASAAIGPPASEAECEACEVEVESAPDAVAELVVATQALTVDSAVAAEAELAAARVTAAEAVAARRRPAAGVSRPVMREPVVQPVTQRSGRMACTSMHKRCRGCRLGIGVGDFMRAEGVGLVHDRDACVQAARARAVEPSARVMAPLVPSGPGRAPSASRGAAAISAAVEEPAKTRREAVLVARVSGERVQSALVCFTGQCTRTGPRMDCILGCGRSAHAQCFGIAKAHADVGQLRCAVCRAQAMMGTGDDPGPGLVQSACKSMLWELSVGRHTTAQGHAEFQRLEREWVASTGAPEVALPRDSVESLVAFLIWMGAESGRARSFETVWRAAAGVCARTRDVSLTKDDRVKRVHADIVKVLGDLGEPCTQTTRRLICLLLGLGYPTATLDVKCLQSRGGVPILRRSRVITSFEVMGGLRVGETVGDGHGVTANDCSVVTPLTEVHANLGVTVELLVRSSKTGQGRFVNFVGTSAVTKVPSELYIRELWAESGLSMRKPKIDGGFRVERPDYSVVRLELLSWPLERLELLVRALQAEMVTATCESVATHARVSAKYARQRVTAKDISEERRYVNIAGGSEEGAAVTSAMTWARARGFGAWLSKTDGPLLRATESGSGRLTHMPLQPGSTYTHHIGALRAAYQLSSVMEEPDLELELGGAAEAHFANHSNRRGGDRMARETRAKSGASIMDIDMVYGWNEAQRRKDMQLHYGGQDRAQRVGRARVTMFV